MRVLLGQLFFWLEQCVCTPLAVVVAVLMPVTVSAQQIECTLTSRSAKFVAETMVFDLPSQQGGATVFDAIIESTYGAPVSARVKARQEDILRYRWRVVNFRTSPGLATISYRADLDPVAMTVSVFGSVANFNEDVRGNGACRSR
ncbi:hypothetical protein [Tateyamaria sp. SN6-1]|uniref:hypothetical protein n=1 Tax=Tateyamaria sp. SN6-1 TaxID=3092148 RepID=UPI0039F4BA7D